MINDYEKKGYRLISIAFLYWPGIIFIEIIYVHNFMKSVIFPSMGGLRLCAGKI